MTLDQQSIQTFRIMDLFRSGRMLPVYLVVLGVAGILLAIAVLDPEIAPTIFFVMLLLSVATSFIFLRLHYKNQDEIKWLMQLSEANPNPIMEFDSQGTLKYFNPAAGIKYPRITLNMEDRDIFDISLVKSEIQAKRAKILERQFKHGDTTIIQKIIYTPETDSFKVYMTDILANIQVTKQLEITQKELESQKMALINVLEDVSEQRNLTKVQSRLTLENIGEGVVLTSQNGSVEYVNPAFTKMTGYTAQEMYTNEFATVILAFDLKDKTISPEQLSDAAMVTAKNQETKLILQKKNGEKIAVIINATIIKVDDKFEGVARVIHDYSEDLRIARQKDEFFSIASHELRTPLTVISGNLDILLDMSGGKLPEEQLALMHDVVEASDRLTKIVNDFLNVSRLDQGRLKVDMGDVNLCELVGETVDELKVLADKKGISLTNSCGSNKIWVKADLNLLREIIVNLIGNSLKFTSQGGIDIKVHQEGERTYLNVTDTGLGIDKSRQGMLFQRFQQAMDRTLSRDAGGTGLGLYISREFARIMGGDLRLVSSEKDKGSVFECYLQTLVKED